VVKIVPWRYLLKEELIHDAVRHALFPRDDADAIPVDVLRSGPQPAPIFLCRDAVRQTREGLADVDPEDAQRSNLTFEMWPLECRAQSVTLNPLSSKNGCTR
jgi:hypothetical protein